VDEHARSALRYALWARDAAFERPVSFRILRIRLSVRGLTYAPLLCTVVGPMR
jgi:hypothetical protein